MTENKDIATTNPLKVANELRKELQTLDVLENRQEVLDGIKDQFLADRLESNSVQEQVKTVAVLKLLEKLQGEKVSTAQLLKIIETLSKNTEIDINAILGGNSGKGTNVIVNNNPQTANINPAGIDHNVSADKEEQTNPIQDAGFLLEALDGIKEGLASDDAQDCLNDMQDVIDDIEFDE